MSANLFNSDTFNIADVYMVQSKLIKVGPYNTAIHKANKKKCVIPKSMSTTERPEDHKNFVKPNTLNHANVVVWVIVS